VNGKGSCLHRIVENNGKKSLQQLIIYSDRKMHYNEYIGENFNHKVKDLDL